MFAIVDINNFYASCERIFDPKLRNKPVAVLSNNDGCIIARSNEAKKLGIKMGQVFFEKENWLKKQGVAVLSSNYPLYADMSNRMVQVLREMVDDIIIYSIDEVFIDLSSYKNKDLRLLAFEIKDKLLKYLGLPVSVGIAPTKTLAKTANFYAKRYSKFKNVLVFDEEQKIKDALKLIDVGEIWGIGRRFKKFLKANGIKSALDLRNANEQFIKKHMSVVGLRTVKELKEESCIEVESIRKDRKNMAHTRTFKHPIKTKEDLKAIISTFTVRLTEKLRFQKSAANMIGVFVETSRFENKKYRYYNSKTVNLTVPSNDTFELIKYALKLTDAIFVSGYKYKRAGVMVFGLQNSNHLQYSLFDTINRYRNNKILNTLDFLNASYGRDVVKYAVQGDDTKNSVQERLSPQYTTSWNQIIGARADENFPHVPS
ncbi:MAG: SOS mutagenesis and repair protein UmuC [Bacteroidetes bacterium]|nr:MAG: SOS mutagenesis and repair protein UmuC [Bacteroidota bacterium]